MRVDTVHLGRWHQTAVYAVTGLLVVSGLVWVLLHYFGQTKGDFGPAPHPLEVWMLRVHGGAAMAAFIAYGSLLPIHVRRAWAIRRNIYLGITLIVVMLLLTVTAYLLYYSGSEETRPIISAIHWIIGVVVAPLLTWHVISGRAQTRAVRKYSVGES